MASGKEVNGFECHLETNKEASVVSYRLLDDCYFRIARQQQFNFFLLPIFNVDINCPIANTAFCFPAIMQVNLEDVSQLSHPSP